MSEKKYIIHQLWSVHIEKIFVLGMQAWNFDLAKSSRMSFASIVNSLEKRLSLFEDPLQ
jgi:hypothetical protein